MQSPSRQCRACRYRAGTVSSEQVCRHAFTPPPRGRTGRRRHWWRPRIRSSLHAGNGDVCALEWSAPSISRTADSVIERNIVVSSGTSPASPCACSAKLAIACECQQRAPRRCRLGQAPAAMARFRTNSEAPKSLFCALSEDDNSLVLEAGLADPVAQSLDFINKTPEMASSSLRMRKPRCEATGWAVASVVHDGTQSLRFKCTLSRKCSSSLTIVGGPYVVQ